MELLQLRYFVALAESENLTKTANALYISPSSLSLTISKLEREVGVKLFDRVGRKLRLNDNGQEFLRHLRSVLTELDSAVSQLQQKNFCDDKNFKLYSCCQVYLRNDTKQTEIKNNVQCS